MAKKIKLEPSFVYKTIPQDLVKKFVSEQINLGEGQVFYYSTESNGNMKVTIKDAPYVRIESKNSPDLFRIPIEHLGLYDRVLKNILRKANCLTLGDLLKAGPDVKKLRGFGEVRYSHLMSALRRFEVHYNLGFILTDCF